MRRIPILIIAIILLLISLHSGRTDGKGGHYDRSTGEYHYHHGRPAHDHYDIDGDGIVDCPYTFGKDDYVTDDDEPNEIVGYIVVISAIYIALLIVVDVIIENDGIECVKKYISKIAKRDINLPTNKIFWIIVVTIITFIISAFLLADKY